MSMPKTALQPSKHTIKPKGKPAISHEDSEELKRLDAACARLKQATPENPYHLTIPTDPKSRYHHWTERERDAWRQGTFFEAHEEYRQYLSLHYDDTLDTLIQARTDADAERDRARSFSLNGAVSGSSTPTSKPSGVPKKRINLSDYKAKLAGSKASTAAPTPKKRPEPGDDGAIMNGVQKGEERPRSEKPAAPHGQKRPLEDTAADSKPSAATMAADEPPVKKARASLPPKPPSPKEESKPSNPHGLPPLISPIRGEAPPYGLPAMLSPGLPAAIEVELSRMPDHSSSQPGTPSSVEKAPQHKATVTLDPVANKIANSLKKSEDVVKRLAELEDRKAQHDAPSERSKERSAAPRVDTATDEPLPKRRQRYIVKLRYGRKNRKRMEQILRLPSRNARQADARARSESAAPKLEKSVSQEKHRMDSAHRPENSGATSNRDTASSTAKKEIPKVPLVKRKLQEDDPQDLGAKRQRALSGLDAERRPSTPLQAALQSPGNTPAKASGQKLSSHLTATQRKEAQGAQMQRSISADSTGRTLQAPGHTPRSVPISAPNGTATEVEQWTASSKKYNDLGRKIKYEWQAIGKEASLTAADKKRGAVLALQCLLCYMLAFHCSDTKARLQRRPCSLDATWLSMLPLWATFQRACQPFPHLDGLRFYLGLVIRNAIAMTTADRINLAKRAASAAGEALDASVAPRNGASDAPTPTPSSASGGPAAPSGVPSLENIRENSLELARNAREAAVRLSAREILQAFPDTWQAAADDADRPAVGSLEKEAGDLLTGKFWLPICADTTPVQVVRFGLKLLREWVAKEELSIELAL